MVGMLPPHEHPSQACLDGYLALVLPTPAARRPCPDPLLAPRPCPCSALQHCAAAASGEGPRNGPTPDSIYRTIRIALSFFDRHPRRYY